MSQIRFVTLICVLLGCATALAQEPLPSTQPDNVAGTWTISSKNANGTVDTKTIELKQNGNDLTGHFKGPNQSGGLEGTINEHHILFRTKTREPLTFRGQVDGDTISGTFNIRGKQGEWHATRISPN